MGSEPTHAVGFGGKKRAAGLKAPIKRVINKATKVINTDYPLHFRYVEAYI